MIQRRGPAHLVRNAVTQLRASSRGSLLGTVSVPGDKSISHRALILAALAAGDSRISGLLESDDVLRTAVALRSMGAHVERLPGEDGSWRVAGLGVGGLREPEAVLDLGNSGTGVRLLMGVAAAHPLTAFFTGDDSLVQRPMARVAEPLRRMGAHILAREGTRLPLAVTGAEMPVPVDVELAQPSAQVKSAILLAGLGTPGETTVVEPLPTRDHTERLLGRFGADVWSAAAGSGRRITVVGEAELVPCAVEIPGDPSAAAFIAVAALTVPGSDVRVPGVCVNPTRTGLFDTLLEMGADLRFENPRQVGGEPVADLAVRASRLAAVTVPAERAPALIDEYPALAVAAAMAEGETRMQGLGELRVKESDRLAATAAGLGACGVAARIDGDDLVVTGCEGSPPGGGTVSAPWDHRIAMAFLVLGLAARAPVVVEGVEAVSSSFPGFAARMAELGADIAQ